MAKAIDALKERLNLLNTAIEQSILNHNALVGRHAELKEIIQHLEKMDAESLQASLELIDKLIGDQLENLEVTEHA